MLHRNPRSWLALLLAAAVTGVPGAAQAVDLTTIVVNVAPAVTLVSLSTSSATPTAGGTTGITVTVTATDANGYNDLTGVTVKVLRPDGTTVHVASAAATFGSGSLLGATYTRTIAMNYYDPPATGGSTYKVVATATDQAGATGDNSLTPAVFNYATLTAVSLGSSAFSLGASLNPGDAGAASTVAVTNAGNAQIDIQVSGTSLTHGTLAATIPLSAVAYSLNSDMTASSPLTGSAATLSTFDLNYGSGSAKNVYLKVTVPSGAAQWVPAGTYSGTLTLAAVAG